MTSGDFKKDNGQQNTIELFVPLWSIYIWNMNAMLSKQWALAWSRSTTGGNGNVLMTSGDLENRSRLKHFNRVHALLKVNLNVKYECCAIKTLGCSTITRVIRTKTCRLGQTAWAKGLRVTRRLHFVQLFGIFSNGFQSPCNIVGYQRTISHKSHWLIDILFV